MWFGIFFVLALVALIGLGQWYVTRPSSRRPIDPSRARSADEAKYGKDPSPLNDLGMP